MNSKLNIFFQWQNPVLRDTIYPYRKEKLRDFLRVYYEIDLWKKYRSSNQLDPVLQDKLKSMAAALEDEHRKLAAELQQAIEHKLLTDKWFASISGRDEKSLRFKRTYYLDRQIEQLNDHHADLVARQNSLSKRVEWYAEEDTRRNIWLDRAKALDPEITAVGAQLEEARRIRNLFTRQDRLPRINPQGGVSLEEAVRWEVLGYQKELETLDHPDLIKRVVERIESEPGRFEKWLYYMVMHFSGMRYRSAHASWADPKYLLELLNNEFLRADILSMDDNTIADACKRAVHDLQEERDNMTDPQKIRAIDQLIAKLTLGNPRRALQDYHTARQISDIQSLPDDEPVFLGRLELLRKTRSSNGDPIPDWVWQEIAKYTNLRLKIQQRDWEAITPERWKNENHRWREILDAWEHRDITGWRKEHEETLDLIVTRAVCNEIAEHIQHLRGNIPAAGLTGKPKWYLYWQQKTNDLPKGDPRKAFLVQAPSEQHFVNGASILWLDWVDTQPSPWQIAQPLPGYSLLPAEVRLPREKTTNTLEWGYHQLSNNFVRTRLKPTIHELREAGRSEREIEAIRAEMRASGGFVKQYLRWTHEATVVGVEELADGKYVLTFETGQIGLILRRLSDLVGNRNVFVGYMPKSESTPDNLDDMIDRHKLLLE